VARIVQSHRDYKYSPTALARLCQHYAQWSTTVAVAQAPEDYREVYNDVNDMANISNDDERKRQLLLPPPDEDSSFWSPLSSSTSSFSSFHRPCTKTNKKRSLLLAFDTHSHQPKTTPSSQPQDYASGRRVRCRMF